jgi:hypothetical protein
MEPRRNCEFCLWERWWQTTRCTHFLFIQTLLDFCWLKPSINTLARGLPRIPWKDLFWATPSYTLNWPLCMSYLLGKFSWINLRESCITFPWSFKLLLVSSVENEEKQSSVQHQWYPWKSPRWLFPGDQSTALTLLMPGVTFDSIFTKWKFPLRKQAVFIFCFLTCKGMWEGRLLDSLFHFPGTVYMPSLLFVLHLLCFSFGVIL